MTMELAGWIFMTFKDIKTPQSLEEVEEREQDHQVDACKG
jgi:hypothetical protein